MRRTIIKCDVCDEDMPADKYGVAYGITFKSHSTVCVTKRQGEDESATKSAYFPDGDYCSVACVKRMVTKVLDAVQVYLESK